MSLIAKIEAGIGWARPGETAPALKDPLFLDKGGFVLNNEVLGTYVSVDSRDGVVSLNLSPLQVRFLETSSLCIQENRGPTEMWDEEQTKLHMTTPNSWAELHGQDIYNFFKVTTLTQEVVKSFGLAT